MLPAAGGWIPLPPGLWLGRELLNGHHRCYETVVIVAMLLLQQFFTPLSWELKQVSCPSLLQICSSGRCCTPLPPWPHPPGSPAICSRETWSKLYYICYNSRLQDGSDVHVWSISGTEGVWEISYMYKLFVSRVYTAWLTLRSYSSVFPLSPETTVKTSHCSLSMMWTLLLIKSNSWNTLRLSIWKVS